MSESNVVHSASMIYEVDPDYKQGDKIAVHVPVTFRREAPAEDIKTSIDWEWQPEFDIEPGDKFFLAIVVDTDGNWLIRKVHWERTLTDVIFDLEKLSK